MDAIPAFLAQVLLDVDNAGLDFYQATVGAFAAEIGRLFALFLSIYLTLWGLAHWRGLITEPIGDFVTRIVKITLIAALAINAALYVTEFANRLYLIPNEIVALVQPTMPAIPGEPLPASSAGVLDTTFSLTMRAADRFYVYAATLGFTSIGAALTANISSFVITVVGLILIGLGGALLLVAKVALAVLLAVGPIFIVLLLFDATRNLFQAWLSQVLTAMLAYIMASVVIYFALFVVIRYLNTALEQTPPGTTPALGQFIPFILLSVTAIILLLQVPAMAAAIGNGVQISALGIAQATGRGTWRGTAAAANLIGRDAGAVGVGARVAAARAVRRYGGGNRIRRI